MIDQQGSARKLYQIAESQQGLFTSKQAKACGYRETNHPYHVNAGHWIRLRRGVYRLAQYPASDEEQLVLYSLWSANRQGIPQGVYSHATALSLHELSDAMPDKLHMTVPKAFRRFREPPAVLVLHKDELGDDDVELRPGYRVTSPLRTLIEVARDVSFSADLLRQALQEAMQKGLVSRGLLRKRRDELPERLRAILSGEAA